MDSDGNGYIFGISADGFYCVGMYEDWDEGAVLIEPTRSIHINEGQGIINVVRAECNGSTLRLSVNGHLLADINDTTLTSGDIGVGSCSWSGTFTEVAFDNIVVKAP